MSLVVPLMRLFPLHEAKAKDKARAIIGRKRVLNVMVILMSLFINYA
jgi:hypothetical protein